MRLCAVLATLAAPTLGCAGEEPPSPALQRLIGKVLRPPRDVVVAIVPGLDLARLDPGRSPALSSLADQGALLVDVVPAASRLAPSIASALTGRWPVEHRIGLDRDTLADSGSELTEWVADAGYQVSAGATCGNDRLLARMSPTLSTATGIQAGTTDVPALDPGADETGPRFTLLVLQGTCAANGPAARAATDTESDPRVTPDSVLFGERLARVLREWAARPGDGRLLALVSISEPAADAPPLNGGTLTGSALFHWPGVVPSGMRITTTVSATDLAPTVAALAGVPVAVTGQSLLPLLADPQAPATLGFRRRAAFAEAWAPNGGAPRLLARAAVFDGWTLIRRGPSVAATTELYDHLSDPMHRADVAERHPRIVQRLSGRLERWEATLPGA